MKKFKIIFKIILIFFFSEKLLANINNKIIIKVNNEIITNFELKNKILTILVLSNQEINQQNIDKYKKDALNILIDYKLKKIEVSKYNIKLNESEFSNYINSISRNNSLKNKIIENNLDYELYLNDMKVDFAWQKLIFDLYNKKIDIDKTTIENEITKYINNVSTVEEYRISKIEVFFENKSEVDEKIFKIDQEIKNSGFEKAALRFNQTSSPANGDIGWVNSKSLTPKVYNTLKKVNIGDVTKPIQTQNSLIFFKLTDKRTSNKKNINEEQLKKELINQKKNEQFNLYSRSHLLKLKNNSLIEYK